MSAPYEPERHGLLHDVEAAALVELQVDDHERLEPGAEPRAGATHALRDGAHLAVLPAQHRDDAVGFAQLVGAQHDGFISINRHDVHSLLRGRRTARMDAERRDMTCSSPAAPAPSAGRRSACCAPSGHEVRVLSRTPGPGRVSGDLTTGEGVPEALIGVDTVLHLANGQLKEAAQTARLVETIDPTVVRHLFYISIVGVDRNPFPYYRQKLESERLVAASGIPFTILRATQFHDLLAILLRAQRRLPAVVVPKMPVQPIQVEEVAARIVELVDAGPSGRVADIEGPEQRGFEEFAAEWFAAHGQQKRIWRMSLPARRCAPSRPACSLGQLPGYGRGTFAEYAAAKCGGRRKPADRTAARTVRRRDRQRPLHHPALGRPARGRHRQRPGCDVRRAVPRSQARPARRRHHRHRDRHSAAESSATCCSTRYPPPCRATGTCRSPPRPPCSECCSSGCSGAWAS